MHAKSRKFLYDVLQAAGAISGFVANKTREDYEADWMLRSAVERQFGIIGEALSQLRSIDPSVAVQVTGVNRIIAFRNIIVHGYSSVDSDIVWDAAQKSLGLLREEVERLLRVDEEP
jgi:uncharacterized protein with HEPN domain